LAQSRSVSPPVARWFIDTLVSRTKTTIIARSQCVCAQRFVIGGANSHSVLPAPSWSHNA